MLVVVAALLYGTAPGQAQSGDSMKVQALENLAVRTVICFTHPCIGDARYEVRQLLKGRLVSDGYFDFGDLAIVYPAMQSVLQGVVELNFIGTLRDIRLILVDFQIPHDVLKEELERTLPGCEIEADDADADEIDAPRGDWRCSVHLDEGHRFDLTIHLAPEVAIVQIHP